MPCPGANSCTEVQMLISIAANHQEDAEIAKEQLRIEVLRGKAKGVSALRAVVKRTRKELEVALRDEMNELTNKHYELLVSQIGEAA